MSNGNEQIRPTTGDPAIENVVPESSLAQGRSTFIAHEDVNAATQEEKSRVFERVEQVMETLRKGESTRFQASTNIINELGQWSGVTDKEREKALNSYLTEINSENVTTAAIEGRSTTRETSPPVESSHLARTISKRTRDEVEDLIERVSRGPHRASIERRARRRGWRAPCHQTKSS
jgi:hypothetical protein